MHKLVQYLLVALLALVFIFGFGRMLFKHDMLPTAPTSTTSAAATVSSAAA